MYKCYYLQNIRISLDLYRQRSTPAAGAAGRVKTLTLDALRCVKPSNHHCLILSRRLQAMTELLSYLYYGSSRTFPRVKDELWAGYWKILQIVGASGPLFPITAVLS